MSLHAVPQASIYEKTIENAELEAQLEAREKAKLRRSEATAAFKEVHDKVVAALAELDLADAPVRVGRFVVSENPVAAREVAFETQPTSRLVIRPMEDTP